MKPLRALRPSTPAEVILQAFDVVLSEIVAGLDLYKYQIAGADVLDPVAFTAGYIHRLSLFELFHAAVAGKERVAGHDEPVLLT